MKTQLRRLDSIRPCEKNPWRDDQAVNAVVASLRGLGVGQPMVNRTGGIIVGHTR